MAPTMTVKQISLLFLALSICALYQAEAQTITAASCKASDVQAAFNSVSSSTTTVNIPAGTCTWTTQVTLTVPSGNTTLTVQGQTTTGITCNGSGACTGSATDSTVIVDDYASNNSLLIITTNSTPSAYFRLSGITIQGGSGLVKYKGFIIMSGSSQNFRFDHNHLNTTTYSPNVATAGMQIGGCVYGVADHNIIDNVVGSVNNGIQEYEGSCNGDSAGQGNGAWAQPSLIGTATSFYVENNIFNNGFGNDCMYGGRFAFRFNTFNLTSPEAAVQEHMTGSTTDGRGCREYEFYKNTLNSTNYNTNYNAYASDLWSGSGVVWGNTALSGGTGNSVYGFGTFISLFNSRANNSTGDHTPTACTSSTNCSNSFGWCGNGNSAQSFDSTWDQNSNTTTGYLCLDQPGAGQSDLLGGAFPNKCDETTGCTTYNGTWPNQIRQPIYEWMDDWEPVPQNPSNFVGVVAGSITNNVDYYDWCNASSPSGCTSFTGAAGVGSGTRASRPSTCTKGVAYWSTDQGSWNQSGSGSQGVLDLCTATNTWTNAYYTPYTYPHPLDTPPVAPAPPINVKATYP